MARIKNALRGHFIAPIDETTPEAAPTEWLELAHYIVSVTDDTNEETEDEAFYDGDGTPETNVISVAGSYSFEGHYDSTDPAQKMIADMKYKVGEGRKLWHKVVAADGTAEWIGTATATAIIAGSGDASAYETFSTTITYDQIPEESAVTPAG